MSRSPIKVVYDCVVFVQGAGRRNNAARKCLGLVDNGTVQLCLSPDVIAEIEDVLNRPELLLRFPLIQSKDSQSLLLAARSNAMLLTNVPKAFHLPRDPDDEPYTDLAVAAQATFLVTWNDRHLTYLMRKDTPEGVEFTRQFPSLQIVNPPQFLEKIRVIRGIV
ncbi:MAG TPA: putative toxin-antitoxin system toxin component, PIN family [Tepidisphaeraceae bacterium]|jgi:putative PIN family toxin of toxin-antitoxin system|nr:putative toxin-antitoxin system toxin component, PIN family [Tepidisphaeraceae bacterium]